MQHKNRKTRLICEALSLLLLAACSRNSQTAPEARLRTVPASMGDIEETMTFIGNIGFIQTVSSAFETTGVVENVYVSLGDTVRKGDILADLERTSLDSTILKSEISLLDAEDALDELLLSDTAKASAYKDLKDAEVKLDKAEKYQVSLDYPRAVNDDIAYYSKQETIRKQYYEEAKAKFDAVHTYENSAEQGEYDTYEALRKAYLTARDNYGKALNDYLFYSGRATQNDRDQAAANIETAKNAYDKAVKNFSTYAEYPRQKDLAAAEQKVSTNKKTFDKRLLIADIDGTVAELKIHPGDYVTKGTNVIQIQNRERYLVFFDPSELDANAVTEGLKAHIRLDGNPDRTYEGVVTYISENGAENQQRTEYHADVEILDPDEKVLFNMTAEVDIVLAKHTNTLLVPTSAVTTEGNQAYVTVADESGAARKVKVVPGLMNDTITEIIGGDLSAGDNVAVESTDDKLLTALGIDPASYYAQLNENTAAPDADRPVPLFSASDAPETPPEAPAPDRPQPGNETPTPLF